jgi:hypothetical protein
VDRIDLREIERRAYTSYYQDGLLDIAIGFYLTLFGLWVVADVSYPFFPIYLFSVPAWAVAKRRITVPRIGYVKFSKGRKYSQTWIVITATSMLTALVIMGTLALRAGGLGPTPPWLSLIREYGVILIGGMVGGIALGAVAYVSELRRFYAYAALAASMYTGGHFLVAVPGWDVWQRMAVVHIPLGAVILGGGLYMMYRFVRMYPLTREDGSDAAD